MERDKQYKKYEHLARYEGLPCKYVYSLVLQNRIDEVIKAVRQELSSADEALEIAKALSNAGHTKEALSVASHGLTLKESKEDLGDWLGSFAEGQGEYALAQKGYIAAFIDDETLKRYKKVLEVTAEQDREEQKNELLTFLRTQKHGYIGHSVEIFAHENLFDGAIALIDDKNSNLYSDALQEFMALALAHKPVWVIKKAHKEAVDVIEAGVAKRYDSAIGWLRLARSAYEANNDLQGWQICLDALRTTYRPKRKLMALLAEAFQEDDLVAQTQKPLRIGF